MTPDPLFWANLLDLSTCLCTELSTASPEHKLCFCGVVAGASVDFADVGKGLGKAWVRVVGVYPSAQFPSPDPVGNSCAAPLAAQVEVGVARCYPTPSGMTGSLTRDQVLDAAELQLSDMRAMQRALQCCDLWEAEVRLGSYVPFGPEGLVYGGMWTVFVEQVMA